MRFYLKLAVMVALFAGAAAPRGQRVLGDGWFEARLVLVVALGSAAENAAMMQVATRREAERAGNLDGYLAVKEADRLVAERLAAAARAHARLSPDDVAELRRRCLHEALGLSEPPAGSDATVLADLD